MVVTGDPFEGILRTASALEVNLVIMGSHRRQLLREIFVGTTIERVIRAGPHPVLMVNNEVNGPYRSVLAPIEISEPSANAVRVARTMGLPEGAHATLLHAFLALARTGKMAMAGVDQASIDEYTASERKRATDELVNFFAENKLPVEGWSLRVEEGGPFEVISRAVENTTPGLLILGTHGRSGLLRVLLGSVTEEALRSLDVDILAVPPVR